MPEPPTPPHKTWHSRGYLPHLDQPGTVQLIPLRLADAVPADVVTAWTTELKLSGPEDTDDPRTAQLRMRIERYVDDQGHGACWLRNDRIADVVPNALLHFDGERHRLLAWVVMPDHVHVLIETLAGFAPSRVVQSWKSFTAKQANRLLKRKGPIWMVDDFDRSVRDEIHLSAAVSDTEQPPVDAGLVDDAEDWHWSNLGARASRPLALAGCSSVPSSISVHEGADFDDDLKRNSANGMNGQASRNDVDLLLMSHFWVFGYAIVRPRNIETQ